MSHALVTVWICAQTAKQSASREQVLILCGALIGVCLAGGVAILLLRRRLLSRENSAAASATLMEQLRGMRDRGELSSEEFEKTRQAMIRKARGELGDGVKPPKA